MIALTIIAVKAVFRATGDFGRGAFVSRTPSHSSLTKTAPGAIQWANRGRIP